MRYLVFLGSVRDSSPPRPKRLGHRVARAVLAQLRRADHDVSLVDPLELNPEAAFKPHFAYAAGRAPAPLEAWARQIQEAEGYVMISPEYNHSMSPALAHLLNHFGSSLFSYKPSVIVTYSAGQWGGARAAVAMRTFLSELGCLPVSAMVHVPKAQEVFDPEGHPHGDAESWDSYFGRALGQLDWWAAAAAYGRETLESPEPLTRDPSQRNAPPSR
ncbi:MAG: NAD(P)H-dependent oxidoreductase [Myxococcota bacterium]